MVKKIICMIMVVAMCLSFLSGCELPQYSFESRCKTSSDGFVYYEDSKIGLCIIALPDNEDVTIPEFIDNKPVKQLGYKEIRTGHMEIHTVDGSKVKRLTIQHTMDYYAVSFPNVEILNYVDYPYCYLTKLDYTSRKINVSANLGGGGPIKPIDIILTKSNRILDLTSFDFDIIIIPLNVSRMDSRVFDGIDKVVIQTEYKTKPDGWADGWNGDCEVEWGSEI